MCRFLAYYGPSATMTNLLFDTSNSLVKQSRHAKMRHEPLNGDGFGLGWYSEQVQKKPDPEPGTFVSIEPAWSNRNLRQLARKIASPHFFAHVRDASKHMPVSQANCHPFQYQHYLWMHNGHLDQFPLFRRALLSKLSDRAFDLIKGNTDSEHAFALCLDELGLNELGLDKLGLDKPSFEPASSAEALENALTNTIQTIVGLRREANLDSNAQMNFALSNGKSAVFSRFTSDENHQPPSLYFLKEKNQDTKEDTIIVASEPVSDNPNWQQVKRNYMLTIYETGALELKEIDANLSGVPTSTQLP